MYILELISELSLMIADSLKDCEKQAQTGDKWKTSFTAKPDMKMND